MNRYDKMVELNRLLSKEKERRAINALIEMKEEGWISVTELTRRTGLSRTYFYKNPEVRKNWMRRSGNVRIRASPITGRCWRMESCRQN